MKKIGLYCPNCGHCMPLPSKQATGLTRMQRVVLDAIANFHITHGRAPSFIEVARSVGLVSKSAVAVHVGPLRLAGYLIMAERGKWASLVPTEKAWALYGRDADGKVSDAAA